MPKGPKPDATTGATPAFERGSASSARIPQPDESLAAGPNASDDEVRDLIDAIAGATWNTRNRIMEERFHASLDSGGAQKVPAFKPPGEALGNA